MIDYIKLARQAGIDVLEVESERASMWPATPEGLAKFAELVLEAERERCAVTAWNHYMGTCKKTGRSPAMWHEWCAADAIRAMKPNTEAKGPRSGPA
jgi:hypothetical protein